MTRPDVRPETACRAESGITRWPRSSRRPEPPPVARSEPRPEPPREAPPAARPEPSAAPVAAPRVDAPRAEPRCATASHRKGGAAGPSQRCAAPAAPGRTRPARRRSPLHQRPSRWPRHVRSRALSRCRCRVRSRRFASRRRSLSTKPRESRAPPRHWAHQLRAGAGQTRAGARRPPAVNPLSTPPMPEAAQATRMR